MRSYPLNMKQEISTEALPLEGSKVQNFFKDSCIFITGGTGFLGNLLIQKLITDCPDIAKIYLLIRHKKGKTSQQRSEEIFQDPIFDKMKMEKPNYKQKITFITGDLEQPGLALQNEDKNRISRDVNIIFHVAATVKFDEKLKKAVSINLRATKDMINIAKTIKNLKAFVYCSTAYSFHPISSIHEEFYKTHIEPERLLQITETLNDDELQILTPKLLGDWPNTYVFTKSAAEKLIQMEAKNLPITVIRPSMIIPTYKNPVEGWINNLYGPVGVTFGTNLGIIHVARADASLKADMVPGDFVINNMIVAAQYVGTAFNEGTPGEYVIGTKKTDKIPIFNCVSSSENPITWGDYSKYSNKTFKKWQTINTKWYFFVYCIPNLYLYKILHFLLHIIPSYIVDFILIIMGKKPQLNKIYKKADVTWSYFSKFSTREWNFNNENNQALWKTLNTTDKNLFEFSMKQIDWDDYFMEKFGKGVRIYMYKDSLETLPKAQQRYKTLKVLHFALKMLCYLLIMYLSFKVFSIIV